MPRRAIRVLTFLAALAALFTAASTGGAPAPTAEHWVAVRLQGGVAASMAAPPSLAAHGHRLLPVPEGLAPDAFRTGLAGQPGVVSVTPEATIEAAVTPNDLFYRGAQGPYLEPIGAPGGWDITNDAEAIVVAVIDTGVDLEHEDLIPNLWQNPDDADADGIDSDNNGCIDDRYGCRFINLTPKRIKGCGYTSGTPTGDVQDDHGNTRNLGSHGTTVAGIIGARGNNHVGITGVAWRVRLMTLKVLDCGPGGDNPTGEMANVAHAIDYARRMGASIINVSLASLPGDPTADIPILRTAIEEALAEGVIIVAAAGNHGSGGVGFPAAYAQYANVIGVGASDTANGNGWAPYSSYGGGVDLAAPGNALVSTIRSDLGVFPAYGVLPNGTSHATPFVTGLFALLMARNPALAMDEYIAIVQEAASPPTPAPHESNWAGAGIIDIKAALERVPMTVSGIALQDWMPPPEGTPVRAHVDGVECGAAETSGADARYSLRIASASEIEGCGAPGREITLSVGGRPAESLLLWSTPNESLVVEDLEANALMPPPGDTVVQQLGAGWSLAAHLGPDAPLPEAAAALPASWSLVTVWDAAAGENGAVLHYHRNAPAYAHTLSGLDQYDAFWVNTEGGSVSAPNPEPPTGREVALVEGWNVFVYTGSARPAAEALAGLAGSYDQVLRYNNAARLWHSWLPDAPPRLNGFAAIFPFQVYWIHMTGPGVLTME